jgi:hypothetical protein
MTPHRDQHPVDKWEIPGSKIILEEMLGEGCFGEVHRGIVKGPLPNTHMMKSAIYKTVAIKFLKRKYIQRYSSPIVCTFKYLNFITIKFLMESLVMGVASMGTQNS